jgi:NAD-dependent deacetylase
MSRFKRLNFLIFVYYINKGIKMKNLVVLTGAGMSAESGISTFRDSDGLWERYPVEQVATPEGYAANPKLVIDFYNERRKQLLEVKPNRGHELLAELEQNFNVTIITQNVDNLHERAGSTHVVHLHGELTKVTSSYQPNNPNYIKELKPEQYEVKMGDTAEDGSQLRPFIVWFGEAVPMIETAIHYTEQADIFVIIGTSLNVYPAAGLLNYVPYGVPVYLIDPKEVKISSGRQVNVIRKGASEGVYELKKILLKDRQ